MRPRLLGFLAASLALLLLPPWSEIALIGCGLGYFAGAKLLFRVHTGLWLAAGVLLTWGALGSTGGEGGWPEFGVGALVSFTALSGLKALLDAGQPG